MKGHLPYIAIISALIIVIAWKSCQPPREDESNEKISAFQDTISQTRQQIDLYAHTIDSLKKVGRLGLKKSKARQAGFTREIVALKKQSKEQRTQLDSILRRNPVLLEFTATQDTIISRQATEIFHLQEDLRASEQTSQELTQAYETQVRLQARVTGEFEQIVSVQGQQIVRLEKKVRRSKAIGWIGVGAAFILGVLISK